MRHGFLIMAHNNWRQLRTLLMLLDDSRNDIFLHIDKKAVAPPGMIFMMFSDTRLCISPLD